MNKTYLFRQALARYGLSNQLTVAMEECGELTQALSKYLRADADREASREAIAEEIADVQIMCEQVALFLGIQGKVAARQHEKLERLDERLRGDDYEAD